MLPAYFANMAPIIAKDWFKPLAVPVDFNRKLRTHYIFGKNKTIRGFIFAVLFATFIVFLQYLLYYRFEFMRGISFLDYSNWPLFGFLMGFGAITGDLVESFFKRRLDLKPGARFVPWDQLDFVIGALVFVSFVFRLTLAIIITVCLISIVLHIMVNHIGFYLKLRKTKW
jgi:CDP-2,3-bis-(O-geranylgeranyl)-sn-glycerol synthase